MVEKSAADSVMDAGGLSGEHVEMQAEEATQVLESLYGINGELSRLPSEKDDTFKVSVHGKPTAVLKVANPHDSEEELELQIKLMQHVAAVDPTIPIPHIFQSIDGEVLSTIVDKAGQTRKVWAISFLPGVVLDTFDTNKHERIEIGKVLAKLRRATQNFDHALADRMVAWDVAYIDKVGKLIQFIHDDHQRALVQKVLDRMATLKPRVDALRTQVLHNDFSRSNILGDRDNPDFITGIIDFGDTSRTAIAIDVSTAIMHHLPRDMAENPNQDMFERGREIVSGYLQYADLNDEEIDLLPHLTMARVAARCLISTRRAQLFPYNQTYILRNTQPSWGQLEWYLARELDETSSAFKNL